jgi:tRNA threonylcarbamoyladenosine biosynthesis protein TsaE
MIKIYDTFTEKQTEKLGEAIGRLLKAGDFLALDGDLGAGKTVFVRGIARGMGVKDEVTSSTFTIINEYDGLCPLAHMDSYRLESPERELEDIGFFDYMKSHVVVMEWAERAVGLLPKEVLRVKIDIIDKNTRRISFKPIGNHYKGIIREMDI